MHTIYFFNKGQKPKKTSASLLLGREREHILEIFEIQVDELILPKVADAVPIYSWVPMS